MTASIATAGKENTQQAKGMTERNTQPGVSPEDSKEGALTKQIEETTSKIPSAAFLGMAVGSMAVSAILQVAGRKHASQFVGQWAPTILIMGLYNKLVKLEGSESRNSSTTGNAFANTRQNASTYANGGADGAKGINQMSK